MALSEVVVRCYPSQLNGEVMHSHWVQVAGKQGQETVRSRIAYVRHGIFVLQKGEQHHTRDTLCLRELERYVADTLGGSEPHHSNTRREVLRLAPVETEWSPWLPGGPATGIKASGRGPG